MVVIEPIGYNLNLDLTDGCILEAVADVGNETIQLLKDQMFLLSLLNLGLGLVLAHWVVCSQ